MATEFPPNLDDGELWLPADIIPEVGSRRCQAPSGARDIHALARQLAALGLLDPRQNPNRPVSKAEGFGLQNGIGFGYDGYRAPLDPFLQRAQMVNEFGQERVRVLQRRQQQTGPGRFYPFRVNGSGRACEGTGVFLPRVINNGARRKPAVAGNEKKRQQPMRNSSIVESSKQVMPLMKHSAEIRLPQEWTY